MWEVRVSLFRAVTPVSICLASLSKVTCIVLFGLQRLTIDWTKRGGVGRRRRRRVSGGGRERKQIMCSKCLREDKEGLLTWLRVDVPGRKWITAFLTPHWPRHLNLTSSPLPKKATVKLSCRVFDVIWSDIWTKSEWGGPPPPSRPTQMIYSTGRVNKKKVLHGNQLLRVAGWQRRLQCCRGFLFGSPPGDEAASSLLSSEVHMQQAQM